MSYFEVTPAIASAAIVTPAPQSAALPATISAAAPAIGVRQKGRALRASITARKP